MLEKLREEVYKANMMLAESGLIFLTWGNASEIDRASGLVVIKPSGVEYGELSPSNMVIVDLDGNIVEGNLSPSSDTPTHLVLYKAFKSVGGVVHTHSVAATSWAQARREIPAYGTTHADYFYGAVPCTRRMTDAEIACEYEYNTGIVIAERIGEDYNSLPGALVYSHGPFTWGKNAIDAVKTSIALEVIAALAADTERLNPNIKPMQQTLLDKHFYRKHGENAYYGQK